MALLILTKICTKCNSELPLSDFNNKKSRHGTIGKHAECKQCLRDRNKAYVERTGYDAAANSRKYYQTHRDEALEKMKAHRKDNWDRIYSETKARQNKNREQYLEAKRISYQKNKHKYQDRIRAYARAHPNPTTTARRRAALKNAPGNFTKKQWLDKLAFWGNRCYLCKANTDNLEADHRKPVAKGGTNWIANIAPACGPCNKAKGTKY